MVAHVGAAVTDRAMARTAADAAALAAAGAPPGAAQRLATDAAVRNGAIVESVTLDAERAEVRVRVGRSSAAAAAERRSGPSVDPLGSPSGPPGAP